MRGTSTAPSSFLVSVGSVTARDPPAQPGTAASHYTLFGSVSRA
ncbi:hypothetical protein [Arthrobacter oryzae]|nr:hypothetical protein [Arthrobacter oryzae]MDQ0079448.1 hypothetical protein [Arthrobacter oryzae]